MKTVVLIRHAKSDWNDPLQKDFDRPLNARGNRDAPLMAARLLEKVTQIDALISSPANRALSTAGYFADALGFQHEQIIQVSSLYHASIRQFNDVIEAIDNRYNTVLIFSHNAGITDFVNSLTPVRVDNIPACGMFGVKVNIDSWSGFSSANKSFWFFDYPKNIL